MDVSKKVHALLALIVFAAIGVLTLHSGTSNANPSYEIRNTTSSVSSLSQDATTTVTWMRYGTATATTTIALNGAIGSSQALESAKLILYRTASSTLTATRIALEYSPNCTATAPDWYADRVSYVVGATTTTALAIDFVGAVSYDWQFASTSVGGLFVDPTVDTIAFDVPTPTNCVRAVLTVPPGAQPAKIWGMMIGKRQAP